MTHCNSTTWFEFLKLTDCQMSVCWKSSATTHVQLLAFLHYSQGSSFFYLFCTFGSCWAMCYTDTLLHMRSKRLMMSLLVSNIYWISLIVCKTIKNCEQYCRQQLVNIILVINWLILAPISMYFIYLLILTLFEGCFWLKESIFKFYFKCNAILRLQIMSMLQITSAS